MEGFAGPRWAIRKQGRPRGASTGSLSTGMQKCIKSGIEKCTTSNSLTLAVTDNPGGVAATWLTSMRVPTVCSCGQCLDAGPLDDADHVARGEDLGHGAKFFGFRRECRDGLGGRDGESWG